jgi:O-antigen ligase
MLHGVVELAALGLIAFVALARPGQAGGRWVPIALSLVVAVPLIELIPLPPGIWQGLPGRSLATQIALGVDPHVWYPISFDAWATQMSLLALAVPVAAFLLTRGIGSRELARSQGVPMLWCIVAIGCMSALLGLAQWATDAMFLYASPHNGFPLGLFANRNHQAALMAITLALTMLLAVRQLRDGKPSRLIWSCLPIVLLTVTVALLTQSRAGVALLCLAVIPTFVMLRRSVGRWVALAVGALVVAGAVWLILTGSGQSVMARMADTGGDERFVVLDDIWFMTTYNFPLGSGLGTFARAFLPVESLTSVSRAYLNHAHCEYLEIVAECGLAGVIAIVAALGFVGLSIVRIARLDATSDEAFVKLAAVTILVLLLVHSLLDYPARTFAIAAIAGAAVGMLTQQSRKAAESRPASDHTGPDHAPQRAPADVFSRAGQIALLALVAAGTAQTVRIGVSSITVLDNGEIRTFWPAVTGDALALEAQAARQRGDLAMAGRQATRALHAALYNSKALEILGDIALVRNEPARAAQLLALSARVTWRNSDVQWWQVRQALNDGDVPAAINAGDALLRRERNVDEARQAFAAIAASRAARGPLVERVAENPPWAQGFALALLDAAPEYQPQMQAFLIAAMKRGFHPDDTRWGAYFREALDQGQGGAIAAMSHIANPGRAIDPQKAIVDAGFGEIAANRPLWGPFGWKLRDTGAYFNDAQSDGQVNTLNVDRTGGGQVFDQRILLGPGRYVFGGVSGRTDPANGLASWQIKCSGGGTLAEVPIGGKQNMRFSQEFTVPSGCPVQIIALKVIPDSANSELLLGRVEARPVR